MLTLLATLLPLLGGATFRAVMGQAVQWVQARQDHRSEMEMMRLQAELDDRRAAREAEAIRLQHSLGVQTIRVQGETDLALEEARAFSALQAHAAKPSGIRWVDAWNASVRPAFASICLVLWVGALVSQGFQLTEWDRAVMGVVIGFFFADRSLRKMGR
jgi:hypothetical protein